MDWIIWRKPWKIKILKLWRKNQFWEFLWLLWIVKWYLSLTSGARTNQLRSVPITRFTVRSRVDFGMGFFRDPKIRDPNLESRSPGFRDFQDFVELSNPDPLGFGIGILNFGLDRKIPKIPGTGIGIWKLENNSEWDIPGFFIPRIGIFFRGMGYSDKKPTLVLSPCGAIQLLQQSSSSSTAQRAPLINPTMLFSAISVSCVLKLFCGEFVD